MPGLFLSGRGHLSFGAWQSGGKAKEICEGASAIGRNANKGVVKADFSPCREVLDLMRQINRETYPLTRFFDAKR